MCERKKESSETSVVLNAKTTTRTKRKTIDVLQDCCELMWPVYKLTHIFVLFSSLLTSSD